MAIEHTLLGLLAVEPRHGYELNKEFAEGTVLGEIVHLESGMLYAHLKRLEQQDWVASRLEAQESRPPRRVFELTPAGRDELQRWMSEPVGRTRDIRLEFLLKLYLTRQFDVEQTTQLIQNQREVCNGLIESLNQQISEEQDDFRLLVLEMRLAQNQALARWLEQVTVDAVVAEP